MMIVAKQLQQGPAASTRARTFLRKFSMSSMGYGRSAWMFAGVLSRAAQASSLTAQVVIAPPAATNAMATIWSSFVCRFLLIVVVFMGVVWWLGNPASNISTGPI